MKKLEFINSKTARSGIFLGFIGGLFLFTSIIFEELCNNMILEEMGLGCINTLESAGILAYGYITFFAVRFGIQSRKEYKSKEISSFFVR